MSLLFNIAKTTKKYLVDDELFDENQVSVQAAHGCGIKAWIKPTRLYTPLPLYQ